MAKFCGVIGYGSTTKTSPGVFKELIVEKTVYGDLIKKILILFLMLFFANCAFAVNSYDKYWNKTESYKTNSNGRTTAYDRYGNETDSFKTDSSGRTTQYDKYGNKVGSYK